MHHRLIFFKAKPRRRPNEASSTATLWHKRKQRRSFTSSDEDKRHMIIKNAIVVIVMNVASVQPPHTCMNIPWRQASQNELSWNKTNISKRQSKRNIRGAEYLNNYGIFAFGRAFHVSLFVDAREELPQDSPSRELRMHIFRHSWKCIKQLEHQQSTVENELNGSPCMWWWRWVVLKK